MSGSPITNCGNPTENWIRVNGTGPKVCPHCYEIKQKKPIRKCISCDELFDVGCNGRFVCAPCRHSNSKKYVL